MRNPLHALSLRGRMVLFFSLLGLLVGLPTYLYLSSVHREQLLADREAGLQALAQSTATVVSENLTERRREVELLARTPLFVRAPLDASDIRASLERLKQAYPHYSWIGLTDAQGVVRSATSGHLEGQDASKRPWFGHGREGVYLGDLHEAVLLSKLLAPGYGSGNTPTGERLRFIDFASPVHDEAGRLRGVLAAHAHWRWAGEVLKAVVPANAEALGIDVFIVNRQGTILYPERAESLKPPSLDVLRQVGHDPFLAWSDGARYLTAAAGVATHGFDNTLDWRIVVRQPEASVLADMAHLQRAMLFAASCAALFFVVLIWLAADSISRPLELLSEEARRIERGEQLAGFEVLGTTRDVRALSVALGSMAKTLLSQREQLALSNRELEVKVGERTEALQRANAELDRLAHMDTLTQVPNRLSGRKALQREFQRYRRKHQPYAVLMVDIDHFKRVNDTHGHAEGDRVLQHVAGVVQQSLRGSDFVARIGGEEFFVLLPDTELAQALQVADKLRSAVAETGIEAVGPVTVSVGVSAVGQDDADEQAAVKRADEQLYAAKAAGRNCVSPAPDLG